jgi:hypothetical protein
MDWQNHIRATVGALLAAPDGQGKPHPYKAAHRHHSGGSIFATAFRKQSAQSLVPVSVKSIQGGFL